MEKIKKLTGHSGCEVILYKNNNYYFIRKKSTNINYNTRLELQIKKQIDVSLFNQNYFKVPKIISTGFEDGFYFADMEFIKGETVINYLSNIDHKSISNLVEKIVSIIEYFSNLTTLEDEKYFEKILLKTNETLLNLDINLKYKNKFLTSAISKKKYFDKMEPSFCHGDFTLENILINSKGELYLIDFLDNFTQNYYFDIVKIYQDIEGEWYKIKNDEIKISKVKLLFFKKLFDEKIIEKFKDYKELHYYLLSLTFLRILPYTKEEKKYIKIKNKINKYLNLID